MKPTTFFPREGLSARDLYAAGYRFVRWQLGYYDPLTEPATVKIDEDKVLRWLTQGAQPSDAARTLLKREGVLERYAASRKSGSTPVQA